MKKLILALVAMAPLTAVAHGTLQASFGGQIIEAGDWRIEFAVRDGRIRAWVRDHDDRTKTALGKATVLAGGQKLDLVLTADGDSLTVEAPVMAGDKLTAVLALTVAGKPVSARFAQEAVVQPAGLEGKATFDAVCAACHGTALRGTDAGPPLLHPLYAPGSGHGDDVVLVAIANGAKAHMWKFGDMPKPDVKAGDDKALLAYIRAMQAANGLAKAPAGTIPLDHSQMHHH